VAGAVVVVVVVVVGGGDVGGEVDVVVVVGGVVGAVVAVGGGVVGTGPGTVVVVPGPGPGVVVVGPGPGAGMVLVGGGVVGSGGGPDGVVVDGDGAGKTAGLVVVGRPTRRSDRAAAATVVLVESDVVGRVRRVVTSGRSPRPAPVSVVVGAVTRSGSDVDGTSVVSLSSGSASVAIAPDGAAYSK
jgi:hypothetical protein